MLKEKHHDTHIVPSHGAVKWRFPKIVFCEDSGSKSDQMFHDWQINITKASQVQSSLTGAFSDIVQILVAKVQ